MNIYEVSYKADRFIVIAETEQEAKETYPSYERLKWIPEMNGYGCSVGKGSFETYNYYNWLSPDKLSVKYLGKPDRDLKPGVLMVEIVDPHNP